MMKFLKKLLRQIVCVGQQCPVCRKQKMRELSDKEWLCPTCGHYIWL